MQHSTQLPSRYLKISIALRQAMTAIICMLMPMVSFSTPDESVTDVSPQSPASTSLSMTTTCYEVALAADINPDGGGIFIGVDGIYGTDIVEYEGELYFSAGYGTSGVELCKYNGVIVSLVEDIEEGSGDSYPSNLTVYDGDLYFVVGENFTEQRVWKYDGTEATPISNAGLSPNVSLIVFDGDLYFSGRESVFDSEELLKYDGTQVTVAAEVESNIDYLTVYNGALYFSADDGTHGQELWKYNGMTASLVEDINSGSHSSPGYLTVYDGELYFSANDGTTGTELWKYDGVDTSLVADIWPGGSSNPSNFTVHDGALYFSANDGINGVELWKYDGTNTTLIANIFEGADGSFPGNFLEYNGELFFSANDGTHGIELWKYDGIIATLVAEISSGSLFSGPANLIEYAGDLFFSAPTGSGTDLFHAYAVPCSGDCDDGIQNGDEEGIDCGGSNCVPCPTCDDGIQNGDEDGIDCGGSNCGPCATCDDGIQNGDEDGIDCGGSNCGPCAAPEAVCGVVTVYIDPANPAYDGPGIKNIWWIPSAELDAGSTSSSTSPDIEVMRYVSNIPFDWTTNGACIDAVPNGRMSNSDKGIIYRDCLPVTNTDFNKLMNYKLRISDDFGVDDCFGKYLVVPQEAGLSASPVIHYVVPDNIDAGISTQYADEMSETEYHPLTHITVTPNPGSNIMKVDWQMTQYEPVRIAVYDMTGQAVFAQNLDGAPGENTVLYQMDNAAPGMYLVHVSTQEKTEVLKWIKMHE